MTETDLGDWSEFGTAAGMAAVDGIEAVPADESLGNAQGDWVDAAMSAHTGFGAAPDLDGLPDTAGHAVDLTPELAPAAGVGLGASAIEAASTVDANTAPPGYHDQVDADGDGHLDHATYRGDGHGGAEILVDLNGDGRIDFIGHDTNLDNRVDFADYDKDHDGVFEEREYDDNHDGILDRMTWLHGS